MSRILVVEDEPVIRSALLRLLQRNGYDTGEAGSVESARGLLADADFDLVIADLRLPGAPGTDMIGAAGEAPVLIMTSFASVRSAVDAMKLGAFDYIAKPFDHDEMLLTVARILGERRTARQNQALKRDVERSFPITGMVGNCAAMRDVCERIDKVAPTDTTVLVVGESGTGKELAARAVHERSRRSAAPIITVNCAAIPRDLIESELFGHERGSFTGAVESRQGVVEAADGGSLFLDEIGELPLEAQARLLRVLQDGEIRRVGATHTKRVDVRLIAATHRDLQQMVADDTFREDLYFRLHVMEIRLPPLRERGADIEQLALTLLARSCERLHRPALEFDQRALGAVRSYDWPGNVRELEHAIERAVILAEDGAPITVELLAIDERAAAATGPATASPELSLEEYFRAFVTGHQHTLTETEIAERLGISRKALWERRQRLGIPRPR